MITAATLFACFLAFGDPTALLVEHRAEIHDAAKACGISARLLASVVYAERSQNLRPGEDLVDIVLARCGYNSSVGVAQVKVETAVWISENLGKPESPYYLAMGAKGLLKPSASRQELIDQLAEPKTNLLYAAAYLAMIAKQWGSAIEGSRTPSDRVALLATLYSLGLERSDGSMRTPHAGAKPDRFGEIAREFFDSFMMREEFAD